ncbi:MAG: MerR family transcriptional regulator [Roseibium sp.]|uniref:MerR family transcriptional regulator n=1 Tax=Roseibium sp. TaxID=1936156 RepID=UPI00262C1200|nr:MerR family transcriptional regulator [Roseibium sp.]MCV0424293.1 MerR family transcriptional regulator [Roseibium sp.]
MDRHSPKDTLLTAAECASRIGISVKALRVYEAQGLLAPLRTEKNWRLYGAEDIARLNEIMFLKQLGLSLSEIAKLLSGQTTDVSRLLEMQETLQNNRLEQAERSLRLICSLRAKCGSGDRLSMDDLLDLAKEVQMSETADEFAWKRYVQARPRTKKEPDSGELEDCAGEYRFDDGSVLRITTARDRLRVQLLGQPACDLFCEEADHYFLKVTPAQIVFSRNKAGDIDGLVLHQGGYETKALRCETGAYDKAERELDERIKAKTPFPGSEQLLRKVIEDHRKGQPDYDSMSPVLRSLAQEQIPTVMRELERLGAVGSIEFRGIGVDGFDIYIVDFENGRLEWGLAQAKDGTLTGLYLRPTP